MIRRICIVNLRNRADAEDVFQEVFLKLLLRTEPFENDAHEKAWLCKVAFNQCKDLHKSFWHRNVRTIEDLEISYETPGQSAVISAVLALPPDWKQIVYLHYYEQMSIPEIAALMKKNTNTVYTMLRRAKKSLKANLEVEF